MKTRKWEQVIRDAIKRCGKTGAELARCAGVPQPVLSRFVAGTRSVSLLTAERLAAVVGIELKRKG